MANELMDPLMLTKQHLKAGYIFSVKDTVDVVWMSQPVMAEFFEVSRSAIISALADVLEEWPDKMLVRRVSYMDDATGRARSVQETQYHFSLICAVSMVLNGNVARSFRQWMVQTHSRYVMTGAVCDAKRVCSEPSRTDKWQRLVTKVNLR